MVPYSRSRSLWWWTNILWKSVKYGAIFTVTEFVTVNQYIANFNMMQHCTTKQRQCLTVVQKITLTRVNTIMQMITSEERDMEWNNRIGKTSNQLCFSLQICAGSKKNYEDSEQKCNRTTQLWHVTEILTHTKQQGDHSSNSLAISWLYGNSYQDQAY